eukprot:NODE_179_length_15798_cov_0.379769.p7 type:complete len:261 gc:universal NODE_179_length_15798_cov_0.379769:222-1004(+)
MIYLRNSHGNTKSRFKLWRFVMILECVIFAFSSFLSPSNNSSSAQEGIQINSGYMLNWSGSTSSDPLTLNLIIPTNSSETYFIVDGLPADTLEYKWDVSNELKPMSGYVLNLSDSSNYVISAPFTLYVSKSAKTNIDIPPAGSFSNTEVASIVILCVLLLLFAIFAIRKWRASRSLKKQKLENFQSPNLINKSFHGSDEVYFSNSSFTSHFDEEWKSRSSLNRDMLSKKSSIFDDPRLTQSSTMGRYSDASMCSINSKPY